ncbi:hypothetical protein [Roseovarius sp. 2305UL8-3]|uniref:hypothetical protein n=1 Tax=Roseovarius conchicola TaxID=3121636 RepID=UPI003526D5A6
MRPLALIRSLTRRHMQLEFTSGPHRIRILDRPGLSLPASEQAALREAVSALAMKVEPRGSLDYGVFLDDPVIWGSIVLTLIYDRETGALIAFNALRWIELDTDVSEAPVLHLGLAMVDPDYQSHGVSWILYGLTVVLLFLRGGMRPLRITSVSQVPAIIGRVALSFADVYPDAKQDRPRFRHLSIARAIMRDHRDVFGVGDDAWFEEDGFVIRNAYTGGSDAMKKTYEEAAHHREAYVNDHCAQVLDYARGDDLLQVGQMDLPTARAYFLRDVPRESRRAVLMTAGFAILQTWIVPLLCWLDTARDWDGLQPYRSRRDV